MDGTGIKEILDRAQQPQVVAGALVLPNGWTKHDPSAIVEKGPQAGTLQVNTLAAIRDYLAANRDGLALEKIVVHVVSPRIVKILGPLDPRTRAREVFVEATCKDLADGFVGTLHQHEPFIIGLLTRFVGTAERAEVLKVIGTIKEQKVMSSNDDGISQEVVASAGRVLVDAVRVPNPVTLAPFRTFREVAQPDSLFLLRAQGGRDGGLPQVGLFEADGGTWMVDAIASVRAWLDVNLPDDIEVLA